MLIYSAMCRDSEMNEAFEQWSQHQVTQSQRPEPQSPSQREPRPQKFVDTQATADSDDEEEESAARRAKKVKQHSSRRSFLSFSDAPLVSGQMAVV